MSKWPLPSPNPNTPVTFPGGTTVGYAAPIKTFLGRYLDSQSIRDLQPGFRTARARQILVDSPRNRLLMIVGSALFSYDLTRFVQRLQAGEPLVSCTQFGGQMRDGDHEDFVLRPDGFFYAEHEPSWTIDRVDGQDRLFGMDVDDRGNIYLAFNPYGIGILLPSLQPLKQILPADGVVTPNRVMVMGTTLFASPDGGNVSSAFDVSDPANPKRLPDEHFVIRAFAKTASQVQWIDGTGSITASSNPSGAGAKTVIPREGTGPFYSIDTDGEHFFATVRAADGTSAVISSAGDGIATMLPAKYLDAPIVRAGLGRVLVFGTESSGRRELRMFKSGTLSEIPMLAHDGAHPYFSAYYHKGVTLPFVAPDFTGLDGASNNDARLIATSAGAVLLVAAGGLGDAYLVELGGFVPPPVVPPVTPPPVTPPVVPPVTPPVTPPPAGKPPLSPQNCYIGGLDLDAHAKVGEMVSVYVQTVGWTITDESIRWQWGDGTPAIFPTNDRGAAQHAFAVAGQFVIEMRVRRANGEVLDSTHTITVTGDPVTPPTPPPVPDPPVPSPPATDPPKPPVTPQPPDNTASVKVVSAMRAVREARTQLDFAMEAMGTALLALSPGQPVPVTLQGPRIGVCQVPYAAHGWLQPQPSAASWDALRAIGVTDLRLQFHLGQVSPTKDAWATSLFEAWLRPAHDAGLRVCANIVSPDMIWPGTPAPAHQDAAWRAQAVKRLMGDLGHLIASYGLGNEPGFGPWMTDDIEKGGAKDYIRDVYFPRFVIPIVTAIRQTDKQAVISGFESDSDDIHQRCIAEMWRAMPLSVDVDLQTVHPYGDVGGGDYATMAKFAAVRDKSIPWAIGEIDHQQFPTAIARGATRGIATDEEIGKLADFVRMVRTSYPDVEVIYLGTPEYFFTRIALASPPFPAGWSWSTWTYGGPPVVSEAGRRLAEAFK